jgi:rhamnosyltransferase
MSRQLPRQDAYFIVCYDYLRAFDRKNIEGKNEDFFSAVACAFRRELWEENKFYVDGFSEDMAWAKVCREQGYRFQLVEASLVEHSHNYTARQLYRRGFIEGEAEVLIYGKKAQLLEQLYLCTRELVRDFFYALRKGCFWTIPYNIFYRAACHWGFYQGKRAGEARQRSVKMSNEGAQEQSPKPLSATGE